MSWSLRIPKQDGGTTVNTVPVGEFRRAAHHALDEARETIHSQNEGAYDQALHAVQAAVDLVSSGVVKEPNVYAQLNGHVNPGPTPPEGYAGHYVTVSVYGMG